jgi:hypothetical protein
LSLGVGWRLVRANGWWMDGRTTVDVARLELGRAVYVKAELEVNAGGRERVVRALGRAAAAAEVGVRQAGLDVA